MSGQIGPHSASSLLFHTLRKRAQPVTSPDDFEPLLKELGSARVVMLGESSHGSREFYQLRRTLTERLIEDYGFHFVCVEGDWPPCQELSRWIAGERDGSPIEALKAFDRWPTWMWANQEIAGLASWLRQHNRFRPAQERIGFFGLDVYSLFESIDVVLTKLDQIDPLLAKRARARYACFEPYLRDEKGYTRSLIKFPQGCQEEVNLELRELLERRLGDLDLEQNARIVANAEHYYRSLVTLDEISWNIRDQHMTDTLEHLMKQHGPESKAIVWAHNTHIGDYRATSMKDRGQVNLGGLAREKWGSQRVKLVGFSTYRGQVTASNAWNGPIQTQIIPPGRPGSVEAAFHEVARALGENTFYVLLKHSELNSGPLAHALAHRAIGVVYNPPHERFGNYVPSVLPERYDAFVFVDRTSALHPLEQSYVAEDIPETWPVGF